jgi:hypothetical protein
VQEQAEAVQEQAEAVQEQAEAVQEQAEAVQEQAKKLKYRYINFQATNPGLCGVLKSEGNKMFPNPPGSKHASSCRVTFSPGFGYRITMYAETMEKADEMLHQFTTTVKLYVAHKDTYVNLLKVKAETVDNFFGDRDVKFLGDYIFKLEETDDGPFIKMGRKKVSMEEYPVAEMEFWNIHHFFTLLNEATETVHVLNVLRKISPSIDASVTQHRAAMKQKRLDNGERFAIGADGARAGRPVTLADFFDSLQIASPSNGGKKGRS